MPRIHINSVRLTNFRGIVSAKVSLKKVNIFIGANGSGKTTILSAISRLLAALRGEERIFLDADFLFFGKNSAHTIKIDYEIEIIESRRGAAKYFISLEGHRVNQGENRSHLNEQTPGLAKISIIGEGEKVKEGGTEIWRMFSQRVIRSGWGGGRISVISLARGNEQRHAETSNFEEQGYFDALRARFVEIFKKSKISIAVSIEHPNLEKNILSSVRRFTGKRDIKEINVTKDDEVIVGKIGGMWQPWSALSSGEQSAFNLAMAIEFESRKSSDFLLIDEPESNLHPDIQLGYLQYVLKNFPKSQIFISTHSPYIFKNHFLSSNVVVFKYKKTRHSLNGVSKFSSLFGCPTWGEVNYYAYNLPSFEFHNELYGWVQEKTGNYDIKNMDEYLKSEGVPAAKICKRQTLKGCRTENLTTMSYIRNFTHHPENPFGNTPYTESELRSAISQLIKIVRGLR